MSAPSVLVCAVQVPLVEGGAELHARGLLQELRRQGFRADLVNVPFKWDPKDEILLHAAAWRLLDLSESNGEPVDLVIGTKFPSYFARHPNKVTWLVHQHRAVYELCGTAYSDFALTPRDVALRDAIIELDTKMLKESRRVFTIARTVTERVEKFNGVCAETLYHPPKLADRLRRGEPGSYVLLVGRLESIKRPELAIHALAHAPAGLSLLVVGDGSQRQAAERVAAELGLSGRVRFLGTVDDDTLIELYAGCLAVVFAPYEEDYGYVTLEAFLSRKPVITASDSGGVREFVEDGETGLVCEPDPHAIGEALGRLAADHALRTRLAEAGYERARQITWEGVVARLTEGLVRCGN